MEETAKQFWTSQKVYPPYGTIKKRRLYELNYLIPHLEGVNSLLDLGCGDGALIKCLRELTDIKKYFAFDIAENLMSDIPALVGEYDCYHPHPLPKTDAIVFAGVIPFLFEDDVVHKVFNEFKAPLIYVRTPCGDDELVDTYSEKLSANYASYYRSVEHVTDLLEQHFNIKEVKRAYPDDIESEFGTKQYVFLCTKQS